ncbi:hypothetical protein HPP92_013876 [Vanilla planifolia]|nr:hypothetical protein HPP92_013876 [Vanilla planifolia]
MASAKLLSTNSPHFRRVTFLLVLLVASILISTTAVADAAPFSVDKKSSVGTEDYQDPGPNPSHDPPPPSTLTTTSPAQAALGQGKS